MPTKSLQSTPETRDHGLTACPQPTTQVPDPPRGTPRPAPLCVRTAARLLSSTCSSGCPTCLARSDALCAWTQASPVRPCVSRVVARSFSSTMVYMGENSCCLQVKICWRREQLPTPLFLGFPGGSAGKESARSAGDLDSIPGWEDPTEKGMATHASILAWRMLWTCPWGCKESDTTERLFTFHSPSVWCSVDALKGCLS